MADVFISHSSKDAVVAQSLCGILEQNGISCWMAPRNIMPGEDWATAIAKAIAATRVFIVIYSANSADSTEVPKEIMLAGSRRSYIIPYKIDGTPLRENFEYHLGASHWISADISRGDYKAAELLAAVNAGMGNAAAPVTDAVTVNSNNNVAVNAAPVQFNKTDKRLPLIIAAAAVVLIVVGVLVGVLAVGKDDDSNGRADETVETMDVDEDKEDSGKDKDKDEDTAPQGVIELRPYDSSHITEYRGRSDKFLIFGEEYNEGYVFGQTDAWMMFNVEDCNEVTFTAARVDGTPDKDRELYIYLDGVEQDCYTIAPHAAEKFTIPLNGARILRISSAGNGALPELALYDMRFKGDAEKSETSENEDVKDPASLGLLDIRAYDSSHAECYDGRHEEFLIFGEAYNEGYVFNQNDSWLRFNVKDCDQLTFSAGRIDGTPDKEREIYVYLDGVEYDHYKITPFATEEFTVPVGDAKTMMISSPGNGSLPELGLFDVCFSGTPSEKIERPALETEAYETRYATLCNDRHTPFNIFGEAYNNGYRLEQNDSMVLFNANGYSRFSFTAGRIDGTPAKNRDIHIYLDGVEYDYYTITPDAVESITVPLNGVEVVRVHSDGNGSSPALGLFDISFEGEHTEVYPEAEDAFMLTAYELTHATQYDDRHEEFRFLGESHNRGYTLEQNDSRLLFNVYGYSEVSFTAARIDGSSRKERELYIYLDGREYDRFTVSCDMPEEIVVPINGASTMRIYSAGNGSYPVLGLFNFKATGEKLSLKPAVADGADYAPTSVSMYSSNAINSDAEFRVCGESYENGFASEQRGSFSLAFNVSGYSEMIFTAARIDDSGFNTRRIYVFLDGIEADFYDIGPDEAPIRIMVPLNGAGVVDIRGDEGDHQSPCIGFYDVHFIK